MSACYTCSPSGFARRWIIQDTATGRFHFDLKMRPLLIYTPHQHYVNPHNLPPGVLDAMFADISTFMREYMATEDFQTSINSGRWKNHSHLHFKIKADEALVLQKRAQHASRSPCK